MKVTNFSRNVLGAALAAALAACGGGGSGGTTSADGASVNRGVITGFGSVIVNGIHFDESSANVVINDRPGSGDHKGLKIGMTVKVKGSSDGSSGVATDIEAEHEVEGRISSIDGTNKTFMVLGQTIYTDASTRYDGIPNGFAGLVANMKVEVYGLRDANGVRATLIEAEDDTDFDEEVRGTVSNLMPNTFMIGDLTIHYDHTTSVEHGTIAADLKEGAIVEVHFDTNAGGMPYHATKIEFEDNEDDEFESHDGDETEVEGYVSNYDSVAGTFKVGGVSVRTTSTTKFEGMGTMQNGVRVEVEGAMADGVLTAREVSFKH